jgi:hypothetical protein
MGRPLIAWSSHLNDRASAMVTGGKWPRSCLAADENTSAFADVEVSPLIRQLQVFLPSFDAFLRACRDRDQQMSTRDPLETFRRSDPGAHPDFDHRRGGLGISSAVHFVGATQWC